MKKQQPKSIETYDTIYRKMLEKNVAPTYPVAINLFQLVHKEGLFPKRRGAAGLDFGIGDAKHAEFLAGLGYKMYGVDVSENAVRLARKRMGKSCDVRLIRPGDRLPFPGKKFAMIVAYEVVHWLGNEKLFMETMGHLVDHLEPDGSFIFTMPTERHFLKFRSKKLSGDRYRCLPKERKGCVFFGPTLPRIRKLVAALGLKLTRTMSYDWADERAECGLAHPFSMYTFCATPLPSSTRG